MLDPITIIGLAGNIVQFVDFSWKLLCETKSLYSSSTGITADNDVLEDIANDIICLDDALTASSAAGAIPDQLKSLAGQCTEIAQELLVNLDKIRVKEPHKKWKSFVAALRSIWKKEQIHGLVVRLERLREQTQSRLQWTLYEQNSQVHVILRDLVTENKRLHFDGTQQLERQLQDIQRVILQLQSETKLQKTTLNIMYKAIDNSGPIEASTTTAWADSMKELISKLSSLAEEVEHQASEHTLLRSLYFDGIRTREDQIVPSHKKTFEWLLDPSSQTSFVPWLENESGIYWINGKAGSVCAFKLANFRPFDNGIEPWTQQELRQAIDQLKKATSVKVRFCFFIDGLDEYNGHPDHIVDVLEGLRNLQDIKLCISSRPWNEFVDAFGQGSNSQLALEDLTREDIRSYVSDTLENNRRFATLKQRDVRSQELAQQIVDKARGVFLWVVLVVRSLLDGLRNADSIQVLQRRLHEFPDTLEQFFSHMLFSVDSIYRSQTAQAFQYAKIARRPLPLLTYSFLDDENLDALVTAKARALTINDIEIRLDDMRRRLNGRCKGLLEVVGEETPRKNKHSKYTARYFFAPKVDFLHRTAHDFLETKDVQKMLSDNLEADFEPRLLLCKALLAQLKAFDYDETKDRAQTEAPRDLLIDLVYYADLLENIQGTPQTTLLDQASILFSKQKKCFGSKLKGELGFLAFLIARGLYLYTIEALNSRPQLARQNESALLQSAIKYPSGKSHPDSVSGRRWDTKIIALLLEHGASPEFAWGEFIQALGNRRDRTEDGTKNVLQVTELLLRYGADPQDHIATEEVTFPPRPRGWTLRASDQYTQSSTHTTVMLAKDVLVEWFGEEETRKLLKQAPERVEEETAGKVVEQARTPKMPILSTITSYIFG